MQVEWRSLKTKLSPSTTILCGAETGKFLKISDDTTSPHQPQKPLVSAAITKLTGISTSATVTKLTGISTPSASAAPKLTGIPTVAAASRYTAPVHIDVGGVIYTSSLETLTRYPDTRLAQLFNGQIPIVLDTLKQHYFLDRDGSMFRHILNFVRSGKLCIPDDFSELDCLLEEARYFDIKEMVVELEKIRERRDSLSGSCRCGDHQVVALHVLPDLGERVMVSGQRRVIADTFPEVLLQLMDCRSSVSWNSCEADSVLKFPLNGYTKLTSLQALQRLLSHRFTVTTSFGSIHDGQLHAEYVLSRCSVKLPDSPSLSQAEAG